MEPAGSLQQAGQVLLTDTLLPKTSRGASAVGTILCSCPPSRSSVQMQALGLSLQNACHTQHKQWQSLKVCSRCQVAMQLWPAGLIVPLKLPAQRIQHWEQLACTGLQGRRQSLRQAPVKTQQMVQAMCSTVLMSA